LILIQGCEKDYLTINPFEAEGTTNDFLPGNALDSLHIAVVSMKCSEKKEDNLIKIKSIINSIMSSKPKTDLICFGEAITGWYVKSAEYITSIAETIPGPATDSIALWSSQHHAYISFGMAEYKESKLYNSLVVTSPDGEILSIHRKNTLTPEDEVSGYSSMQNSNTLWIKNFNLGLMICADVNGYWLTKQYIEADFDIILSAFASPIGLPNYNIISRRMDAWQIFPNRTGNEGGADYSGLIYVSDPAGTIRSHAINVEGFLNYTIVK
jgi:predicted amidohydrolase